MTIRLRNLKTTIGARARNHTKQQTKARNKQGNANNKMCGGRRRRRGQDLSAHFVHNKQIPERVRADRVRQLRGDGDDRRRAVHTRPVRHGRPGGLRSPQASVLSSDGRVPGLLQLRESVLVRERQGEVGARDPAPLSEDAVPPGRHPDRLERGHVHS